MFSGTLGAWGPRLVKGYGFWGKIINMPILKSARCCCFLIGSISLVSYRLDSFEFLRCLGCPEFFRAWLGICMKHGRMCCLAGYSCRSGCSPRAGMSCVVVSIVFAAVDLCRYNDVAIDSIQGGRAGSGARALFAF